MTKSLRLAFAITMALTLHFTANSQSVGINTTGAAANNSSILDVSSTNKGVLIPRMSKAQKNAIATPATGLLVFQATPDSTGFYYYNGVRWVWLTDGTNADTTAWKITGNSNITSANFIGTTNDTALRFRIRNIQSGLLDSSSANTTLGFRSDAGITTGRNNTFMGFRAGVLNDTTSFNTFMGVRAGEFNRDSNNVAIGYRAGRYYSFNNQTTTRMTSVGTEAGYGAFLNPKSTAVGYRALWSFQGSAIYGNTTGRNVAIGDSALAFAGYGSSNVGIGVEALSKVFDGYQNVAIGDSSLAGAVSTSGNVAVGYKTLTKQQGQGFNTAVGYYSQRDSSIGTYYNTSAGAYSMEFNRTGIYNVGLGLSAMRNSDSASFNTVVGADAMYSHRKGDYNSVFGYLAGRDADTAYEVTLIGTQAGIFNRVPYTTAVGTNSLYYNNRVTEGNSREGKENTALGQLALFSNALGYKNTAVGYHALTSNIAGYYGAGVRPSRNTAVGDSAANGTFGNDVVAIGNHALSKNGGGSQHVAIGSRALYNSIATYPNTAIGYSSMDSSTTGGANTAVGSYSLTANKTGGNNVAIGNAAMFQSILGSNNTAVGNDAGRFFKQSDNTAIGSAALRNDSTGWGNTSTGAYSSTNVTTGIWNTANGYFALENDTTGSANTVVGTSSFRDLRNTSNNVGLGINTGYWSRSSFNTYIGSYAGAGVSGRSTGGSNTAVGDYALTGIRSGAQNVAMGESALASDSSGSTNVSIGAGSLENHLRGNDNVAVGFWAGRADSAAAGAVYIGRNAGYNNQRDYTIAIGYQALVSNSLGATIATHGTGNTGIGFQSLQNNNTGAFNTALGGLGGDGNNTGSGNTFLGYNADVASVALNNTTAIGYNAQVSSNNSLVLGSINGTNGATASTNVGIGLTNPSQKLHVIAETAVRNAGLFQSSNAIDHFSNGATVYANNTYSTSNIDVAAVKGTVLSTNKGYGVGAFFQGGYVGLWAITDNTNPGTGTRSTWGVYSLAQQSTTSTNYGVYGSASNGATNYGVYCNGSGGFTGTWTLISDGMFKKNVQPIDNSALSLIQKLNPVSYTLKKDEYKNMNFPSGPQYGFVAQEMEKVFPVLVENGTHPAENKTDPELKFKAVNYIGLIPVLTKAMQEQQLIIEKQQKAIDDLLKRVEKLEQK